MRALRYVCNVLTIDSRVDYNELTNKGMVVAATTLHLQIAGLDKELTDEYHCKDNAYDTEWIGNSRCQSCSSTAHTNMLQRLLTRTESRRIRGCTAKNTYHIRHGHLHDIRKGYCHCRTKDDDCQRPDIKRGSLMPEGTKEVRSHVQA